MSNRIEAEKVYQSAVRCWAEGGSVLALDEVLAAAGRSPKDFGRNVNEHKRKIDAGQIVPLTIRAVPTTPTVQAK